MTEQQLRDIIQSLIAQLECDATNLEKGMSKTARHSAAQGSPADRRPSGVVLLSGCFVS